MADIFGGTVPNPEKFVRYPTANRQLWAAATAAGMNSTQKPYNLEDSELTEAENYRIRYDALERRAGTNPIEGTKPDSNRVLATNLVRSAGIDYIFRYTKSTVHKYINGAYTAIVGVLTGSDSDRIQPTVVLDKPVFANAGADKIQLIDPVANTFADLSSYSETSYKFITSFYNRVVGAYEVNSGKKTQIGWSAEYPNIEIWDPNIDISAGNTRIIDNPTDDTDDLTGVFGLDDIMIVLRERSIIVANKQPIASNPFYFRTAIPSIGCDCPWSAHVVNNGVAWADSATRTIWYYDGQSLNRIGLKVETEFWSIVTSTEKIYGHYDPNGQESHFILEQDDGYNYEYIYSWRTEQWTMDRRYDVTSVATHPYQANYLAYEDLVGTYADLVGDYGDLGVLSAKLSSVIYGRDDGEILFEDISIFTDAPNAGDAARIPYESTAVSKVFTMPSDDIHVAEIRVYYDCQSPGWIDLYYRKNEGDWIQAKTISGAEVTQVGNNQFMRIVKNIRCRSIQWMFVIRPGNDTFGINNAQFSNLRYEVHVYRAGESKR